MSTLVNHFSGKDDLGRGGAFYAGIVDAGLFLTLAPRVDGYNRPPPLKRPRVGVPLDDAASLDALPDECLFEILRRVPAKRDRVLASCVSKRWLLLLSTIRSADSALPDLNDPDCSDPDCSDLARCFEGKTASDARIAAMAVAAGHDLTKLSVRSGARDACPASSVALKAVGRCCPGLRTVEIWNAPVVGDDGVSEIAENCRGLEKLDLCLCPSVSDKSLAVIARNCPNLVSLTFESCARITDAGLLALAESCPKLEFISITGCPGVSDKGVSALIAAAAASLRTIKLQNLKLGDASVAVVGYYGKEVTELVLGGLQNVGEKGFWVMANTAGLRKLNSFSVTACRGFTDVALKAVAKACPGLKQLCLRKCGCLSDAGLEAFAVSAGSLESLRIEECDRIRLHGLLSVIANCGDKLTSLLVSKCLGIKDSGVVVPAVPFCACVRSLVVRDCPGFGSSSMALVAKMCPKLQQIDLRGLPGLTDSGLFALVESREPSLVKVNLSCCPNLTDGITLAIVKIHGSTLKTFGLEGCKKITDATLVAIAENCALLRDLDVSECAVTDHGVSALSAAKQLKLQILSMSHCMKVSNRSLPALAGLGRSLIGLNLQRCCSISTSGIGALEEKMWWCDILS